MFEYIVEIISIWISIKILKLVGDDFKDKGAFESGAIFNKLGYWIICFVVMLIVWAIFTGIFGYTNTSDLEFLILFSSINGFSSRYFGKTAFWVLLIFTFLRGLGHDNPLLSIIIAMIFFFITRDTYRIDKNIENKPNLKNTLKNKNEMDSLNTYLLGAKELSSKAFNDFQNNNENDAIEKWSKSLEYYKKAEKIAKSNKDKELIQSINNNIKLIVQNILDAKIKLASNKIEGMVC
ncbi:hypothetical protein [Methanococcus aeolicus]|uniref:hypothetical protein n=1 Tax=Methanococcus aeolicus TaxID=42879 RepID=UPI0021C7582C|nr:hypothetical protein [Methanococcus aeolicus]UXM84175.1 hypothetical protein N6C89_05295 [Methanococcus aeolicus]